MIISGVGTKSSEPVYTSIPLIWNNSIDISGPSKGLSKGPSKGRSKDLSNCRSKD